MFIYLRATVNVHTFSKKKIAMCFTQCTRCTHDIIYPKYVMGTGWSTNYPPG